MRARVHGRLPAGEKHLQQLLGDLRLPGAVHREREVRDELLAAVEAALNNGARTRDLGGELGTGEMGDAVVAALG